MEYEDTDSSKEDERGGRPTKRARGFIARQACEACRGRKTRCDQGTPCSLCKTQQIQCVYTQRKPTRNEVSLSMIFHRLERIESKIEAASNNGNGPDALSGTVQATTVPTQNPPPVDSNQNQSSQHSPAIQTSNAPRSPDESLRLSFSAHQTVHWPGLHLPQSYLGGTLSHITEVELGVPSFAHSTRTEVLPGEWLATLTLSTVKALSNAYFATFNRIFPFIDRDYYFYNTLSTVVEEGFNQSIEACLVLGVMALGCLGVAAFKEANYHNEDAPLATSFMENLSGQGLPGDSLFNEARRRIGLCLCANDIQVSQYYLTAALFSAQAMRPVEQWMMTDRTSTNCLLYWQHLRNQSDQWMNDMQARVFWSCLLMETVITQELDLPSSRLRELEDDVPLPKFLAFPHAKKPQSIQRDESYYHYHFLAQIAHRRVLLRIRDEMYHFNPSAVVATELRHQLEQWLVNLPPALRLSDIMDRPSCPAELLSISLLQTRYRSAIHHLGRPFLYKALSDPSSVTDQELEFCAEALQNAANWPIATDDCKNMDSFSPLKYYACCSFFGTLVIVHALKESGDERLQSIVPAEMDTACSYMLHYIDYLAPMSVSLRKDLDVLATLYGPIGH